MKPINYGISVKKIMNKNNSNITFLWSIKSHQVFFSEYQRCFLVLFFCFFFCNFPVLISLELLRSSVLFLNAHKDNSFPQQMKCYWYSALGSDKVLQNEITPWRPYAPSNCGPPLGEWQCVILMRRRGVRNDLKNHQTVRFHDRV